MSEPVWNDRGIFGEEDFAEVRRRVTAAVKRREQWRRGVYAAAVVLVTMAGTVWMWHGMAPEPLVAEAPGPVAIETPVAPPKAAGEAPRETRRRVRRVRRPAPAAPKAVDAEPLLVKLETSDPDVVIYWIVESKGDSE